jgi:hypothetical protein
MTWICIRNIPPELYGINLEKWKREQTRTLWARREVPIDQLEDYVKRGARVLQTKELTAIIEEPSTKSDTAGKIFKDVIIKDKVDSEIYADLLKAFGWTHQQIGKPNFSYYSALDEQKVQAYFIVVEGGIKTFKMETRILRTGSQEIVYIFTKREPINGLISVSYVRQKDGIYEFDSASLSRKEENKKDIDGNPVIIERDKIPETYHLPRAFIIDEARIKKKIFEDD